MHTKSFNVDKASLSTEVRISSSNYSIVYHKLFNYSFIDLSIYYEIIFLIYLSLYQALTNCTL
jgi:hypothetical protein